MARSKIILKLLSRIFVIFLCVTGIFFSIILVLAFTTRPFYTHHWLGTGIARTCAEPEAIVLFGGGGMPSGENMVRVYYAAEAQRQFADCQVYICLHGDTVKENSSLAMMSRELIIRGVPADMIRYLPAGKNTRAQVLDLAGIENKQLLQKCLLIVTSPGHMRRCALSLQKAGFENIIPFPAFEIPLEGELRFDDRELGGERRIITPSTGQTLTLRYEFWTQLNYQLLCAREFVALAYYWLRGWI